MQFIINQTESFAKWHHSMRDMRAKIAVSRRIERFENGNLGDVKAVGHGVSEMRVDVGAGYRVYFIMRERVMIVLLAGGAKATQKSDIDRAIELAKEY